MFSLIEIYNLLGKYGFKIVIYMYEGHLKSL